MSWWETLNRSAMADLACPYCGRTAGQPCVTKGGAKARIQHWTRIRPLYRAWRLGGDMAEADVLDSAIDMPAWFASRVERRRRERAS